MSASTGVKGYGSTIAGSALSTVVEVTKIGGPNLKADSIELTHMTSDNRFREYISGLLEGGEVSLELNYTKAQCAAIATALGTTDTFTLTLSDSSTWVFTGFINALGQETPHDGKISNTAGIQVSGKPVFTAA